MRELTIYKFRLVETTGWSTFGAGWHDVVVLSYTEEEATIHLRKSHKAEHWKISSCDDYPLIDGLTLS